MAKVPNAKSDYKAIVVTEEGNTRTIDDVYNSEEFKELIKRLLVEYV